MIPFLAEIPKRVMNPTSEATDRIPSVRKMAAMAPMKLKGKVSMICRARLTRWKWE